MNNSSWSTGSVMLIYPLRLNCQDTAPASAMLPPYLLTA